MNETLLAEFVTAINNWRSDSKERSWRSVYAADRAELRKVLSLCRKGALATAYNEACRLDTIVRDEIPQSVWDVLVERART